MAAGMGEVLGWLDDTGRQFTDHRPLTGPQSLIIAQAAGEDHRRYRMSWRATGQAPSDQLDTTVQVVAVTWSWADRNDTPAS